MTVAHKGIAILVAFIWGIHFVIMKIGMQELPHLVYGWVRFVFSTFPLIFFVKRPANVSWGMLFIIGLLSGVLHQLLILLAIDVGLSPGLSSLLLQSSVFFTVLLSVYWLGAKLKLREIIGMCLAFIGILGIAFERGGHVTSLGLLLILLSAFFMAIVNILYRKIGKFDAFALSVWMGIVPAVLLLPVNIGYYGLPTLINFFSEASWITVACLAFTVVLSSLVGTTLWSRLFQFYPPEKVVPYSLMIPVFGVISSCLFFKHFLPLGMMIFMGIVFIGLMINQISVTKQRK